MQRMKQVGPGDSSRKHPKVARWRLHTMPSSRTGWLRTVFLISWVWLFTLFVVFAYFCFPKWTDYISMGCGVAIPTVVVVAFIFDWQKGFEYLALALLGFMVVAGFSGVPINSLPACRVR